MTQQHTPGIAGPSVCVKNMEIKKLTIEWEDNKIRTVSHIYLTELVVVVRRGEMGLAYTL